MVAVIDCNVGSRVFCRRWKMKEDPVVFIKELSEQDRPFMLNHFLGLSPADRRLRFGAALPDEAVTKYVNAIDFDRDTVFGVYESTFNLVGVGHLAFPPPENLPPTDGELQPSRVAEFGVSVSAPMRRKNVGTKLFDRAAIHCRNRHINTLYIHCLASNRPMICIAEKAGMEIHKDHGEVDGYLKLPHPDTDSFRQENAEERAAMLDYALNGKMKEAVKWLKRIIAPEKNDSSTGSSGQP